MSAAILMAIAWAIEIMFGWPNWLYKKIRHPVVWFGVLVALFDGVLNQKVWSHPIRYVAGVIATVLCVSVVAGLAFAVSIVLPQTWWGIFCEAVLAASLLASRSLHTHVAAVAGSLIDGNIDEARRAVSMIVGRDPKRLEEAGIARAGLESLAENASDGVIAPLFWGVVFGLPGLAAYKAINTLDSMIGHRNERYHAFGGFAARLDDAANFLPARMTGALIAISSLKPSAFLCMLRDAGRHRSLNAGWPEAAMAGGLGVRLSGPRAYGDAIDVEPWLNEGARDPNATDMVDGLSLYLRAMALAGGLLISGALGLAI